MVRPGESAKGANKRVTVPRTHYAHAPIIEAVIEVRFASVLSDADVTSAATSLRKFYPDIQEFQTVQVELDTQSVDKRFKAKAERQAINFRLSGNDQQHIAMVWPMSLIVSQLAPYPGWDDFISRFSRDWKTYINQAGRQRIVRIGLRYINRVDIPNGLNDVIHQADYVAIGAWIPTSLGPTIGYSVQAAISAPSKRGNAVLNTAIIQMPIIPNHTLISLDIDVGLENDLPQNDDGVFASLAQMRDDKNALFETLITDRARELFS